LVALSLPRYNKIFSGLPLDEALGRQGQEPFCGIMDIDLDSGKTAHWLRFTGGLITELYDIQVMQGIRCPRLLGFMNDQIRHTISPFDKERIVRHTLTS